MLRGQSPSAFPLPSFDPPKAAARQSPPGDQKSTQTAAAPAQAQQREIANECSDLLKMATALKTAVDKTNADTLSVTVVKKADEIEQFAHKVRAGTGKS
jgi:type VI protein secretion system component VasF